MSLPTPPPTTDRWCTVDLFELYNGATDPDADTAIGWSTDAIQNHITTTPDDADSDGMPDDTRYQHATAILAVKLLQAVPIGAAGTGDRVTSEAIGGYRYTVSEAAEAADIATVIDPRNHPDIVALIGWAFAGSRHISAYELTTAGDEQEIAEWQ